MAVTAQNQSPVIATIPEVLEAGIPAVIQNIRAAQRRVTCDDLAARFFDNAVQSAEMLMAQAIDVHNDEVDNYNSLLERYENTQLKLGLKEKEIEDLQTLMEQRERQKQDDIDEATHEAIQRADKAELMCLELETKLNETTTMLELRNQQVNTLNKSYKEMLKLDPFNLEKRYAKAKRERQDLRKQVADLNQQIKNTLKTSVMRVWPMPNRRPKRSAWRRKPPNMAISKKRCTASHSAASPRRKNTRPWG